MRVCLRLCLCLSLLTPPPPSTADTTRASSLDALFALAEAVSLLDMLASFAALVSKSNDRWCKPAVHEGGPLAIRQGWHPVVRATLDAEFVANDLYVT